MFKELLLNERNVNRDINGKKVKFEASHIKDMGEIIDMVNSNRNKLKLISQDGDWKVSFDISDDALAYAKIATSYNLNQYDIGTEGNVVTLTAKKKG